MSDGRFIGLALDGVCGGVEVRETLEDQGVRMRVMLMLVVLRGIARAQTDPCWPKVKWLDGVKKNVANGFATAADLAAAEWQLSACRHPTLPERKTTNRPLDPYRASEDVDDEAPAETPTPRVVTVEPRVDASTMTPPTKPETRAQRERRRLAEKDRANARAEARAKRQQIESERKEKEAAAEATAMQIVCGDKPQVSAWDGAVGDVKDRVKATANDPDSISLDGCTEPVLTKKQCWVTDCQFRGTNVFGAKIRQRMRFFLRGNHVVSSRGLD